MSLSESSKIPGENNIPQFILQNIEREKRIGEMISEFKNDLRNNPKYKEYFDQFDPASVESFIENYSSKKASFITFGEAQRENEEKKVLRYLQEAEERLWEIQRKKLFNLQCQWHAELIKIPGIEISVDFEYWETNIGNCPLITPISDDEFNLYVDYVLYDEFNDFKMDFSWMGYQEIKDAYKKNQLIPPWYEFYDNRMGTGTLLVLPDIRGEKEKYYLEIWRNSKIRIRAKKQFTNLPAQVSKPSITLYDDSVIEEFIVKFENSKILDCFRCYDREMKKSNDELEQALKVLQDADEDVQVEGNLNWREAVILAAKKYEQKKIAEALRQIYKKYLYRINFGIAQEIHSPEENVGRIKDWISQIKNEIIQGRKLLEEPADLNF
jgi:hypothetical protein